MLPECKLQTSLAKLLNYPLLIDNSRRDTESDQFFLYRYCYHYYHYYHHYYYYYYYRCCCHLRFTREQDRAIVVQRNNVVRRPSYTICVCVEI